MTAWLRRFTACFRRISYVDLLEQDLEDSWVNLREATKNREHWEALERMFKTRHERLAKELRNFAKV